MIEKKDSIRVLQVTRVDDRTKINEVMMENRLEAMQSFLDGNMEAIGAVPDGDRPNEPLHLLMNEEGKFRGFAPTLIYARNGQVLDHIAGNAVFVRSDEQGDFVSLTDEDIQYLKKRYEMQGVVTLDDKSYHVHLFNG